MSSPSSFDTLVATAPKIALTQALSAPGLRESVVVRALAQISGDQSESAGVVVASAPSDMESLHAVGRAVLARAEGPGADYPFDIQLDSQESRSKFEASLQRLNAALLSADGDWQAQRSALLSGLGSEIARRAGKTLASPEVAGAVAGGQPLPPETLGADEIVVFEVSHSQPFSRSGSGQAPSQIAIGVMDRQSLAAAAQSSADTVATIDVAGKLRSRQADAIRAPGGPKA